MAKTSKNSTTTVAKAKPNNVGMTLNNDNNSLLSQWQPIINSLVESPGSGIRNEGDALLVLLKAHELGIGFANAIPHIHVINGKSGIDIHIIKAILTKPKTGVRWTLVNNFTPIFEAVLYTKITTDTMNLPENAIKVAKLSGNPMVDKYVTEGKVPYVLKPNANGKYVPTDYITTYEFTRKKKDIDDTWIIDTYTSSFTWSEAVNAGLVTKDVWAKWGKTMLDHRAFTPGARAIASDLLMGNYSYEELLTINNYIPVEYDDNGNVTSIVNKNGDIISPKNIEDKTPQSN
jgi:hypothetical protein